MKIELDELLCTKYPQLFRLRHASVHNTALCWGFECGDGWFKIIDLLCLNITRHLEWCRGQRAKDLWYNRRLKRAVKHDDYKILLNPKTAHLEYYQQDCQRKLEEAKLGICRQPPRPKVNKVVVQQVKEKFGTLRFYYTGGDEVIDGMVQMAESMSAVTCEQCGMPGRERGGSWIKTCCDQHA